MEPLVNLKHVVCTLCAEEWPGRPGDRIEGPGPQRQAPEGGEAGSGQGTSQARVAKAQSKDTVGWTTAGGQGAAPPEEMGQNCTLAHMTLGDPGR